MADFNNWRVIDQQGLIPLVDVIAQVPNYSLVKSWFLKAVPKLSEYIVIPESRRLHVRFKASGDAALSRISGQAVSFQENVVKFEAAAADDVIDNRISWA